MAGTGRCSWFQLGGDSIEVVGMVMFSWAEAIELVVKQMGNVW